MGRKRKAKAVSTTELAESPTEERLKQAAGFYAQTGEARSNRRFVMMDDNLGRSVRRKLINEQQYAALQRYALHWYAGGLAGALSSFDLDRIRAMNPSSMGGLARSERELTHKKIYRDARLAIGDQHGYIADMVACHDYSIAAAGVVLGYASPYRGRVKAAEMLAEAGNRLDGFWQSTDRKNRYDQGRARA